ncbi:hypothetical protein GS528_01840 [Rhodococcus hoagii]|nr:hypothetical protein [Prescottella equi]
MTQSMIDRTPNSSGGIADSAEGDQKFDPPEVGDIKDRSPTQNEGDRMSKINRKLPIALCAVAASAGIALSVAPAASATIGSTTTNFSMSCYGSATVLGITQAQDQAQPFSTTVTHGTSGSNQSFAVAVGAQSVPTTVPGRPTYTVTSLTNIKIRVQIDGSTYVSHSLSGGSGYTGTATATKTTSSPTGNAIIEISIPSVTAGGSYTPPTLTVIQTSTVAPKLSTGNGGNGTAATQRGEVRVPCGELLRFRLECLGSLRRNGDSRHQLRTDRRPVPVRRGVPSPEQWRRHPSFLT